MTSMDSTKMILLKDALLDSLSNWRSRLPTSWRDYFTAVELNFHAVSQDADFGDKDKIWPLETNGFANVSLFKAFESVAPQQIRVVVFGNDPYTRITQATGRSFEQGDLRSWHADLRKQGKVSPSMMSLLCAAAATNNELKDFDLTNSDMVFDYDEHDLSHGKRQPLWFSHIELCRAFALDRVDIPSPTTIFDHWSDQGVMWLNRTLTYSRWDDEHRRSHTACWEPFTQRVMEILVDECADRQIVFTLWGGSAKDLEEELLELADARGVLKDNLCIAKSGHPQWPAKYFERGNPLEKVNEYLDSNPIRWT